MTDTVFFRVGAVLVAAMLWLHADFPFNVYGTKYGESGHPAFTDDDGFHPAKKAVPKKQSASTESITLECGKWACTATSWASRKQELVEWASVCSETIQAEIAKVIEKADSECERYDDACAKERIPAPLSPAASTGRGNE